MRATIESTANADAVIAAIRETTGEWRESRVPSWLATQGVIGLERDVDRWRFRLRFTGTFEDAESCVLRGTVSPVGVSRARIRMVCAQTPPRWWWYAPVPLYAVYAARSDFVFALVVLVFGAVSVLVEAWRYDRSLERETPEARYLVDRVRAAIDAAESASRRLSPDSPG